MFNILFVIGICAFVSTTSAQLDWWPVLRDSVFYTFTVLVLIVVSFELKLVHCLLPTSRYLIGTVVVLLLN